MPLLFVPDTMFQLRVFPHHTPKGKQDMARFKPECSYDRPNISYRRALASTFYWQEQRYTVKSCPLAVLLAWVRYHCTIARLSNPEQLVAILECLNDTRDDTIIRWYVLDLAIGCGVCLPLATPELVGFV